jgi:hypothetical protein
MRYASPDKRMRQERMNAPAESDTGEAAPMAPPADQPTGATDYPSGFLKKGVLGDQMVKPGDTVTLKVKAVDPETGEVEVCRDEEGEPDADDNAGALERFPGDETS